MLIKMKTITEVIKEIKKEISDLEARDKFTVKDRVYLEQTICEKYSDLLVFMRVSGTITTLRKDFSKLVTENKTTNELLLQLERAIDSLETDPTNPETRELIEKHLNLYCFFRWSDYSSIYTINSYLGL